MPFFRHVFDGLPADARDWLLPHGDDLASAWRSCPRADWLLHIGLAVELGRGHLVQAASDLATDALAARPIADLRPRRALLTTLEWLSGRSDGPRAWAAGFAAMQVADALEAAIDPAEGGSDPRRGHLIAEAVRAVACVAFACDDRADAAYYAHQAYAARAARHAAAATSDAGRAVDRVRARIPLSIVLSAFDIASRPPPPMPELASSDPITDSFYC